MGINNLAKIILNIDKIYGFQVIWYPVKIRDGHITNYDLDPVVDWIYMKMNICNGWDAVYDGHISREDHDEYPDEEV